MPKPSENRDENLDEAADQRELCRITDLLADDVTWRVATRPRRAEWLQAIGELVEEGEVEAAGESPLRIYVTILPDRIDAAFHDATGAEVGRIELPRTVIAPVFREYMTLLQSIGAQGAEGYSPQVEALDIARRLVHNDAADLLMRHARDVAPSHKTARRLFTLFTLMTHDTTKLFSS
jgi:uncharacterized protein (UPF0262 family)